MIIRFTQKKIKTNLWLGITFLSVAVIFLIIAVFTSEKLEPFITPVGISQIAGGVFMLFMYFFEKKNQYLTIKEGEITRNSIFKKKVKISDITSAKYFAGDLILKTETGNFIIDIAIIDPESLLDLKNELKKYELLQ